MPLVVPSLDMWHKGKHVLQPTGEVSTELQVQTSLPLCDPVSLALHDTLRDAALLACIPTLRAQAQAGAPDLAQTNAQHEGAVRPSSYSIRQFTLFGVCTFTLAFIAGYWRSFVLLLTVVVLVVGVAVHPDTVARMMGGTGAEAQLGPLHSLGAETLQNVPEPHEQVPVGQPTAPARSALERHPEQWVNTLLAALWPQIRAYAEPHAQTFISSTLRRFLSQSLLDRVSLLACTHLSLGADPPRVLSVQACRTGLDGVVLDACVRLGSMVVGARPEGDPGAALEVAGLTVSLDIEHTSLSISGALSTLRGHSKEGGAGSALRSVTALQAAVAQVGVEGCIRLEFGPLVPAPPFSSCVSLTLLRLPQVECEVSLELMGQKGLLGPHVDIAHFLPVRTALTSLLKAGIYSSILFPRTVTFRLMPEGHVAHKQAHDAAGLLGQEVDRARGAKEEVKAALQAMKLISSLNTTLHRPASIGQSTCESTSEQWLQHRNVPVNGPKIGLNIRVDHMSLGGHQAGDTAVGWAVDHPFPGAASIKVEACILPESMLQHSAQEASSTMAPSMLPSTPSSASIRMSEVHSQHELTLSRGVSRMMTVLNRVISRVGAVMSLLLPDKNKRMSVLVKSEHARIACVAGLGTASGAAPTAVGAEVPIALSQGGVQMVPVCPNSAQAIAAARLQDSLEEEAEAIDEGEQKDKGMGFPAASAALLSAVCSGDKATPPRTAVHANETSSHSCRPTTGVYEHTIEMMRTVEKAMAQAEAGAADARAGGGAYAVDTDPVPDQGPHSFTFPHLLRLEVHPGSVVGSKLLFRASRGRCTLGHAAIPVPEAILRACTGASSSSESKSQGTVPCLSTVILPLFTGTAPQPEGSLFLRFEMAKTKEASEEDKRRLAFVHIDGPLDQNVDVQHSSQATDERTKQRDEEEEWQSVGHYDSLSASSSGSAAGQIMVEPAVLGHVPGARSSPRVLLDAPSPTHGPNISAVGWTSLPPVACQGRLVPELTPVEEEGDECARRDEAAGRLQAFFRSSMLRRRGRGKDRSHRIRLRSDTTAGSTGTSTTGMSQGKDLTRVFSERACSVHSSSSSGLLAGIAMSALGIGTAQRHASAALPEQPSEAPPSPTSLFTSRPMLDGIPTHSAPFRTRPRTPKEQVETAEKTLAALGIGIREGLWPEAGSGSSTGKCLAAADTMERVVTMRAQDKGTGLSPASAAALGRGARSFSKRSHTNLSEIEKSM